ncbi:MAG: 50S ribosomal protein L21 [Chloroflexi bacterium]|nr:50S ribosomal protein L21 [Chloroflexota bacterium]
MYAIVETGGKQYRVTPGQIIDVDRLPVAQGETIELDKVLLIGDGAVVTVGRPIIEGAKVVARAQGEARSKKMLAARFKAKTRYHRVFGHRQFHTSLIIDQIIGPGTDEQQVRPSEEEVVTDGA